MIKSQPVPNSTSSDVAWQYTSVLLSTSDLSHSTAADHAKKASSELPTAADMQSILGQNSSAGQLVRQPSLPVNFANWWWSVPVINVLFAVVLVEIAWALARTLASSGIAKVTATVLSNRHPHLTLSLSQLSQQKLLNAQLSTLCTYTCHSHLLLSAHSTVKGLCFCRHLLCTQCDMYATCLSSA